MKVFIGFDPRQPVAFHICASSIWRNASKPVEIVQLSLKQLPITRRGLTDFTYSRFLAPWLCGYRGFSMFIDSDFLVLGNVCELVDYSMDASVAVVKHTKRIFEWPSLMVYNNERCKTLTPEYVNDVNNPMFNFDWATDGIEELPMEWNHLVGYDRPIPEPKALHYTKGIPIWAETQNEGYVEPWKAEWNFVRSSVSHKELMGTSVHVVKQ